jgi:UDP-N-acetylmuramoyl-L-alanyl-D-glutamate--2,6-diaminopimelate ligase
MYEVVDRLVVFLKKVVPAPAVALLRAPYHAGLALLMAASYGFPGRELTVIGITGTKGKSSVAEMLFACLRAGGKKTALLSTIRFAIEDDSEPNLFKMTLAGRGFAQRFMRRARVAGATHVVIEITSEATLDYRHWFLYLDALIFTNLEPEHLERHGGMAAYFEAKYSIGKALARSPKRPRAIIAKEDDYGRRFLALPVERRVPFSFADAAHAAVASAGVSFDYGGAHFALPQPGRFSVVNALAAVKAAECFGVSPAQSARALGGLARIAGRAERIEAGQPFEVIVDYAHTPGSLTALCEAFAPPLPARAGGRRLVCVLGSAGGGRDRWKRPQLGEIAEKYCAEVILTDEDPYDEDPRAIVEEMAAGMTEKRPRIIMDRRAAIGAALRAARPGDAVLITGKGTDPYIMGARGTRTPWSDSAVAREELERLLTPET